MIILANQRRTPERIDASKSGSVGLHSNRSDDRAIDRECRSTAGKRGGARNARVIAFAAVAALSRVVAAESSSPEVIPVDINGGSSWNGWTSRGMSTDQGIWASGSTTYTYEIYTTLFVYDPAVQPIASTAIKPSNLFDRRTNTTYNRGSTTINNPTNRPVTALSTNPSAIGGAFDTGNVIFGIGVRVVANAQFENTDKTTADLNQRRAYRWSGGNGAYAHGAFRTVSFGLNAGANTSFQPASTVGGTDGRISFSQHSRYRDFSIAFFPRDFMSQEITIQNSGGTFWGGTNSTIYIPGGYGSGVSYDYPFRAFSADVDGSVHGWQLFVDITALERLYGPDDNSEDSILDATCCSLNRAGSAGVGTIDMSKVVIVIAGWANSISVLNAQPPAAATKPKIFKWEAAKPQ